MRKWMRLATLGLLAAVASSAYAQDAPEPSLISARTLPVEVAWGLPDFYLFSQPDAAQLAELRRWTEEFAAWQEWAARWRGQREPGWLTAYRERRPKPSPPAWLAARCKEVLDEDDPLFPACALLTAWREDNPAAPRLQAPTLLANQRERPEHTLWWEHLHLDLMWPALQWESSVYGVVGVHHSITVRGRLQIFTAPGALLLNLPTSSGARTWKVALNYGVSYRLFDFALPGGRPAELHLNLAKAWIMSDNTGVVGGQSLDVAGFSMTFKKSR